MNGIDVGDTGIDVPPKRTVDNVIVEMTNHVGEASGRVTDADGSVVRDCFVIVFAQDPARWTVQTRYLSVARPGARRSLQRPIAARRLLRRGDDRCRTRRVDRSGIPVQVRDRATKFSIADGETRTIDLRLSPAPRVVALRRCICCTARGLLMLALHGRKIMRSRRRTARRSIPQLGQAPPPAARRAPRSCAGTFLPRDTGQPLRKAQVRIFAFEIRENRMATTDENGAYEFKELRAGRYTISASKGSYVEPVVRSAAADGCAASRSRFSTVRRWSASISRCRAAA